MPNIKSAKKRVNTIKRQSAENIIPRGSMRTAVKKANKDLTNEALTKDAIKKNTAARKKSRLMKKVNTK